MAHVESYPRHLILFVYYQYVVIFFFAHLRNIWQTVLRRTRLARSPFDPPDGYAPILRDWEAFYTRFGYWPIHDCWERVINDRPGAWLSVLERRFDAARFPDVLVDTGRVQRCFNLSSYNYLGFADGSLNEPVLEALASQGVSTCSSAAALGKNEVHERLERLVARFVDRDDSIVFPMGHNTNVSVLPALCGPSSLIISDSLNHASLVQGCRVSGARIRLFRHNDTAHLERVLRSAIVEGQPRTHRPWSKIVIVIEGIYSMEGELTPLPEIIALKNRYGAYLYLDEAHSIGAIGASGRGVCEHFGVPTSEVDVLMGTFTKSFGAVGGYVAGARNVIAHIRRHSLSTLYDTSLSVPTCTQAYEALRVIMGERDGDDGERRLRAIRENARHFRSEIARRGFVAMGHDPSPVCPVLIGHPMALAMFSRECLRRGIACVVVGFPATSLTTIRTRFCLSAAHNTADIDRALDALEEVGNVTGTRFNLPDQVPEWLTRWTGIGSRIEFTEAHQTVATALANGDDAAGDSSAMSKKNKQKKLA